MILGCRHKDSLGKRMGEIIFPVFIFAFLLFCPRVLWAQDAMPPDIVQGEILEQLPGVSPLPEDLPAQEGQESFQQEPTVANTVNIKSLFFNDQQILSIEEAMSLRGLDSAVFDGDIDDLSLPDPGERNIALGGIVYVSASDWTVWLNGKRLTPKALPEEILDMKVFRDYIEMQWFDAYTNKIYPLRLRPYQRFNLDSRIFLPG